MHGTESDTPKRSGRDRDPAAGNTRFDGESARRILQRGAAEQQRRNNELADSWSFEELEEMAAEAGISSEALREAVAACRSHPGTAAAGTPLGPDERPRRRLSAVKRLMPGHWSKRGVLATAGGIGAVGLLLAFPTVAQMAFWALLLFLVILTLLVVLGAAPF